MISAPWSKSTNLNASKKGTYQITVKVTDKNGIELGRGTTAFVVTVSQRDLDIRKQKEQDQRKARKLLQEARKIWENGKLQQAITKATQAQKLANHDQEIIKTLKTMKKKKKMMDVAIDDVKRHIEAKKIDQAESVLKKVQQINPKYPPYTEIIKKIKKVKEAQKKVIEKKAKMKAFAAKVKKIEEERKAREAKRKAELATKVRKIEEARKTREALAKQIRKIEVARQKEGKRKQIDSISPDSNSISKKNSSGYWKMIEIEGSVGHDISSGYYKDSISGREGSIRMENAIRKTNQVYFSGEVRWNRPPEIIYPNDTVLLKTSLTKIKDTNKYDRNIKIVYDNFSGMCGFGDSSLEIANLKINHDSPSYINKNIRWKVKKSFQKLPNKKYTLRVCYSGGSFSEDRGWRYHYRWIEPTTHIRKKED
jgi:hypothetical protein